MTCNAILDVELLVALTTELGEACAPIAQIVLPLVYEVVGD